MNGLTRSVMERLGVTFPPAPQRRKTHLTVEQHDQILAHITRNPGETDQSLAARFNRGTATIWLIRRHAHPLFDARRCSAVLPPRCQCCGQFIQKQSRKRKIGLSDSYARRMGQPNEQNG